MHEIHVRMQITKPHARKWPIYEVNNLVHCVGAVTSLEDIEYSGVRELFIRFHALSIAWPRFLYMLELMIAFL